MRGRWRPGRVGLVIAPQVVVLAGSVSAQWLTHKVAGTLRLPDGGTPHSDALTTTERFRRTDLGPAGRR